MAEPGRVQVTPAKDIGFMGATVSQTLNKTGSTERLMFRFGFDFISTIKSKPCIKKSKLCIK